MMALALAAPEALPSPPAAAPAAVEAPPAGYAPPPAGYALPPGDSPPPAVSPPARRVVFVGAETLPYKDGYPIPEGYHPEMRMRQGLVIAGGVTFGAMYLFSAAGAAASADKSLFVPIAGPFLQLGNIDFTSTTEGRAFAGLAAVVLVVDGLAQLAGAAMLLAGLTTKKEVLVRGPVTGVTVRATPLTMGYGVMGIGLVGTM